MVDLVVDCLRSKTSLEQLKSVWQTLERSDPECTPFSSWFWAHIWWREFGESGDRLRIVIVKNGPEVVGICPLFLHSKKLFRVLSATTLTLLGAVPGVQSTHPGVIALPQFRKLSEIAVMKHILKLKRWDTLELDGIEPESTFAALARQYLKTPRGVKAGELVHRLEQENLLCGWVEYRAMNDGQRALEINQLGKKIKALGSSTKSCELSICSTRHDLNETQDVLYASKMQLVKTGDKPTIHTAAHERFFRCLVPEFFVADMLWQLSLKIDGQTVAVQHYFLWRGDLLLFQDACAPELNKSDVRRFMLTYTIKRGMEQAFRRVRIHSLPSGRADSVVSDSATVSRIRFTSSVAHRVIEKALKR